MIKRMDCTKENPYTPARDKPHVRWIHIGAEEVDNSQKDGYPCGDTVEMECPNCRITFRVELPQ